MLANMSAALNRSDLGVSDLPTGTVTLLLADVENSTGLWETQREEMTTAFARLDGVLAGIHGAPGKSRVWVPGIGTSPYAWKSSSTNASRHIVAIHPTNDTISNVSHALVSRLRARSVTRSIIGRAQHVRKTSVHEQFPPRADAPPR